MTGRAFLESQSIISVLSLSLPLERCLFTSFASFSNWVVCFTITEFLRALYQFY